MKRCELLQTVGILFARWYIMKLNTVVVMMVLMAPFLADMTP